MTFDWDLENTEWWIAGIGFAFALAFLILAIVALVAYARTWRQRDEVRSELQVARAESSKMRRTLEEALSERDAALEELEETRRHLEQASRRILPRLDRHTAKMSELMEMLKSAGEDRRRLGELIAGYREWADRGLGALRRVWDGPPLRKTDDTEETRASRPNNR